MKHRIRELILTAAGAAHAAGALPSPDFPEVSIEEPKLGAHGDYSTNLAMVTAAAQKMPPRKIAAAILAHLQDPEGLVDRTEIAGPGFINFFIRPRAWHPFLCAIHDRGERYGACNIGQGMRIQVEFVSANPTGPLHVGHGRGAAVGDTVANILAFCGYQVAKEYYINDSGRQIQTLGRSVFLRYKALFEADAPFPDDCYQGTYITDLARELKDRHGRQLLEYNPGEAVDHCARWAADSILTGIREDLHAFGVEFDHWFSEQSLYDSGRVDAVLQEFQSGGSVYTKDDARWFKTQMYGDEKDRVVVRSNGQTTYFASDIAYHVDKYERGYQRVIDVWGADHHGYIPRMTAAIEAAGRERRQFDVILVQLVNLLRDGAPVAMSTRAGEFVTLREVVDEVGRDAARFIFLTRHYESPLDFDLALAKQQTNDNPVYYVQYVHARIASIIAKGEERGIRHDAAKDRAAVELLTAPEEIQLIKAMTRYPEVVQTSAQLLEPHRITFYLMELASAFHAYYNRQRVLNDDPQLSRGRLYLVLVVKKVIRNGLRLLGVSAPEKM